MPPPESQIDTTIEIVTPENISFQYEVAGPFRRLPAFVIDLIVRVAIMAIALLVMSLAGAPIEIVSLMGLLAYFVLEWFYGGVLETYWNGQTVGKRMMGLRVLSVDGQPINGLQGIMRNILRLADMMPLIPLFSDGQELGWMIPTGLIGLVSPLLNRRYQRLGDVVCGTIVIVEEKHRLLAAASFQDSRVKQCAADLPPSLQIGVKLARALAAYTERRKYISIPRRQEIAKHLAIPLLEKINWPANTDYDLLMCALYYRMFVADSVDTDLRPKGLDDEPTTDTATPVNEPVFVAAIADQRSSKQDIDFVEIVDPSEQSTTPVIMNDPSVSLESSANFKNHGKPKVIDPGETS